ncbi:MAG: hypothetical protein ACOH1M_01255 [Rhodoglobus sp.]
MGEVDDDGDELDDPESVEPDVDEFVDLVSDFFESDADAEVDDEPELESLELFVARESLR